MENSLLQGAKELAFEFGASNQQTVLANGVAALRVRRASVSRVCPVSATPGNDRDAAPTFRTFQQAGEKIRRCRGAPARHTVSDAVQLANQVDPFLCSVPQVLGDDSLLGNFYASPFAYSFSAINSFPCLRVPKAETCSLRHERLGNVRVVRGLVRVSGGASECGCRQCEYRDSFRSPRLRSAIDRAR